MTVTTTDTKDLMKAKGKKTVFPKALDKLKITIYKNILGTMKCIHHQLFIKKNVKNHFKIMVGKSCCLERGRLGRWCGTLACGHNHLEPSSSGGSDRPYPVGSDRPSSLQAGTLSWFLLLSGGVETKTTYF